MENNTPLDASIYSTFFKSFHNSPDIFCPAWRVSLAELHRSGYSAEEMNVACIFLNFVQISHKTSLLCILCRKIYIAVRFSLLYADFNLFIPALRREQKNGCCIDFFYGMQILLQVTCLVLHTVRKIDVSSIFSPL